MKKPPFGLRSFTASGLANLSPLITQFAILFTPYGLRPVKFLR